MLRQSFEPRCNTFILSTVSQEERNINTTIDVLNYVSEMKNIKMQKGKIEVDNNVVGSPRYKSLYSVKDVLTSLNYRENDLFKKMLHNKSTKLYLQDYIDILDRKRSIFKKNKTLLKPIPPPLPKKSKSGQSPRKRNYKPQ